MSNQLLSALAQWYASQCNGEWEHHRGISIESCDNPGWWVKIDLEGTSLSGMSFAPVSEGLDARGMPLAEGINDDGNLSGARWLSCHIKDGQWHGIGDETRLAEILGRFLTWASRVGA